MYRGVFQECALRSVRLPSTLTRIEYRTFMDCKELKAVDLPEGLNYIGTSCFYRTGLESVEFPTSLRTLCQAAFAVCKSLRRAEFGEGLAVLGTNEYPSENENF